MTVEGYHSICCQGVEWLVKEDGVPFLEEQLLPLFSSSDFFEKLSPVKIGTKKMLFHYRVSGPKGEEMYLIKRYRNNSFFSCLASMFITSKAMRELKAAVAIVTRGISTVPPVAVGIRRERGLIRESYVVISMLGGCLDLNRYFLIEYPRQNGGWSIQEKWKIVRLLGELVGLIHQKGILQVDFALNNFLLTKDERGEPVLYVSDFEKVRVRRSLSFKQRVAGLVRLNRVGRELSMTDRLRFLKAYLREQDGKEYRSLAHTIQRYTLQLLKKDLARGRMTSVYTDALYNSYRGEEIWGYYRKGYRVEDLLDVISRFDLLAKSLPHAGMQKREELRVTLDHEGRAQPMVVVRYYRPQEKFFASTIWSRMCILAMGGLPLILPHAVMEVEVKGNREGYLFIPVLEGELSLGEYFEPSLDRRNILRVIHLLVALIRRLHCFGRFTDMISESDIVVIPRGNMPPSLYLKNVERFEMRKEVVVSERKRELALLGALLKKYYPGMNVDLSREYFKGRKRRERN